MVDPNKISEDGMHNGTETSSASSKGGNELEQRICIFCKTEKTNSCCRVNKNVHVLKALESLYIDYRILPKVTDYGCYDCFKNIMILSEKRRMYERNILKSRANYYIRCGDKKMCAKYLAKIQAMDGNFLPIITPGSSDLKITDVRTIRRSQSDDTNRSSLTPRNGFINTECDSLSPMSNSSNVLFDPMYEKPEPVVVTESGGKVQAFMNTVLNKSSEMKSNVYNCSYCSRTYKQLRFLRKHEKMHTFQRMHGRRTTKSTVHICSDCDMVLDSIAAFKSHKDLHKDKFKCSYCDEEFLLRHKMEFHEAICLGKIGAMQTNGNDNRKYYTRSQKTAIQDYYSDDDEESDSDYENSRSITDRIERWLVNADNDGSEIFSSKAASVSGLSFLSTSTRFTSVSQMHKDSTGKRRKIQRKDSIHSARKRRIEYLETPKWICPEKDCGYLNTSLEELMEHDVEDHRPLPLFYCTKCRRRCVRRLYLEEHFKYQAYGRWVCCLCQAQFDNEPHLKEHFYEHSINPKHKCEICTLTFIKDHELQKHLCTQEHLNKKMKRRSIFLERIVYKPQPKECSETIPPYTSTIKILKLMDQERTDNYDYISWQNSWKRRLLKIRPDNKYGNCAGLVLPKSPNNAGLMLQNS